MAGRKKVRNKDGELNAYGGEVANWMERRLRVVADMTDYLLRFSDVGDFAGYPAQTRFNISGDDAYDLSRIAARRVTGQSPAALMPNYKERPPIVLAINELDDGHQF